MVKNCQIYKKSKKKKPPDFNDKFQQISSEYKGILLKFFEKNKNKKSYVKHGQIWLNGFLDDHHTNYFKELEPAEFCLPEYERPLDVEDYSGAGSFQRVGDGRTGCPQCERPLVAVDYTSPDHFKD
jgi:hypothetical protein